MKPTRTSRGFEMIVFRDANGNECSLQQSSAVGDYPDAINRPGTSFIWLGRDGDLGNNRMHLSWELVSELLPHMKSWLDTGSLVIDHDRMTYLLCRKACQEGISGRPGTLSAAADLAPVVVRLYEEIERLKAK